MLRHLSLLTSLLILFGMMYVKVSDQPILQYFQLKIFDEFQKQLPRPYQDAGVIIVDIDDESLAKLGQWPWPRNLLAQINDKLAASGAAAISYDIVFAEPDRTSPHLLIPQWEKLHQIKWPTKDLPDYDQQFATSLKNSPSVTGFVLSNDSPLPPVLKSGFVFSGQNPTPMTLAFTGAISPMPEFTEAATGNGALNSLPDSDGILRMVPLVMRVGTNLYPSLSAESLRVAQGASTIIVKSLNSGDGSIQSVKIGNLIIPTDKHGRLWVYYTTYLKERYLPVWKLLEPGFDPAQVQGKIVLIGTSAAGLRDIRSTPLNRVSSGVEVHAQAIEQAVLGQFISRPDWITGGEILFMLVAGIVIIVIVKRVSPLMGALVTVIAVASALYTSWYTFHYHGFILEPVYASVAIILVYLTESTFRAIQSDRERRQVRRAFTHYMSPALVEQLAADPAKLQLGGEVRTMSILFSDVRGFTTLSEQMQAHELTRFLNRFLTPMTGIILSNKGTIDKYIGDCIMAFWNAPLDDKDHARNACLAALGMTQALTEFNRLLLSDDSGFSSIRSAVEIGIGINTGECSVGNMGSDMRFDYSVIGDRVNLASRLEGQCKEYHVPIIIGEDTYLGAPTFAVIELDLIQVKGKKQPVRIYALLGSEELAKSVSFQTLRTANESMLKAYRSQQWQEARKLLSDMAHLAEGIGSNLSGYVQVMQERMSQLAQAKLPADWNGVFTATSK